VPLVELIISAVAILLMFLTCAVIGQGMMSLFRPLPLTCEEKFFYGLGIGLGTLSCSVYLIGLLGWLTGGIPVLVIVGVAWAGAALTLASSRQKARRVLRRAFMMPVALARGLPRFYLYSALIILLLSFLGSGVPVHQPDDMHLYSLLPKRFVEAGRILDWVEPDSCAGLCMVPLGGMALFTFLYGLGGDPFVLMFQFLIGVLTLVATGMLFRRFVGDKAAMLGVLVLITTPIVVLIFSATRVDLLVALIATLSLHAFGRGLARKRAKGARGFFILGAIFIGFSVAVKLTAIPLVAVVYGSLILLSLSRRFVLSLRQVVAMAMLSLAVVMPWLARAWWHTGNPVWPFLNNTLNQIGLTVLFPQTPEMESFGHVIASPTTVLGLAWRFVYDFSVPPHFGAHILFLTVFPLVVLFWSAGFTIRALAVVSAAYFWLLFSIAPGGQFRYLMAGVPAMSAVTGFVLFGLNHRFSWTRPITNAMLGFSCVVAVLLSVRANFYRLPYVTGFEMREQFLTRMNLTYSTGRIYPNSMFLFKKIFDETGLLPFSNRLRYEAKPMSQFKIYYGEALFERAAGTPLAVPPGSEPYFVVAADSGGHVRLIPVRRDAR